MIKEIKINNYRGLSSEFAIFFGTNSKNRRKDKFGVAKVNDQDLLLTVSLLGKNASGKTSFIQGIHFLNILCGGTLYNNALQNLLRREEKNNKIKNDSTPVNISKDKVMKFLHDHEFNNAYKSIDFKVVFLDSENEIELSVSFMPDGFIFEKIILNDKEYFKGKSEFEKYKSKILDVDFKKVPFQMLGEIDEMIPFFSFKNSFKSKIFSKERLLSWIKIADDKIIDIEMNDGCINSLKVKGFDNQIKKISPSKLSSGTHKWINTAIDILPALTQKQSFIFYDEVERHFHPKLALFILALFNDAKINKKKSQLLFSTHSPSLLDHPFRKDAINYIENGKILNIAKEFNVREDLSFSKNYFSEKLAAHPNPEEMFDFMNGLL